jgi:hypothetical protein
VEKDPADRFPTAEALVEEIDAAQLAEPEIPLPIRLFAGELSTLSLIVLGALVIIFLLVQAAQNANMSSLDIMLPVVGLLAVLVTRTLTTMSEGHRIAESGFSREDIADGLARVMAERTTRREELRAQPVTRRRRRATIIMGAAMLVASFVMIRGALALRVQVRPGIYQSPPGGVVLVLSGFALLGISLVLLLRSPFRMTPAEGLLRLIWLGPVGRGFVWLSTRGARATSPLALRQRISQQTSAARRTGGKQSAAYIQAAASPNSTDGNPLAALEARVGELERWRRLHGD